MTNIWYLLVRGLTSVLPQLVLASFCIYYYVKKRSPESILLTAGTSVGALTSIFYVFIMPYLKDLSLYDPLNRNMTIYSIINIIGFLGNITFITGFIMLIVKSVRMDTRQGGEAANGLLRDKIIDDSVF